MNTANIFALIFAGVTAVFVLGLVLYRLLWTGSSLAGYTGILPKRLAKLQRWLQGEHKLISTEQRR